MVELELLESRERTIARLGECQPPLLELTWFIEGVTPCVGLTQVGQGDEDDTPGREQRTEQQSEVHGRPGAPAPL